MYSSHTAVKPYAPISPTSAKAHTLLNQISTRSKPISYGARGNGASSSKRSAFSCPFLAKAGESPCLQLLSAQHNKSNKRTADTKYTCWLNTYIHRLCVISPVVCAWIQKNTINVLLAIVLSAGLQSISLNGRQLPELRGTCPQNEG